VKHILKKATRLKWNGRRLHFFHGDCQISCSQECLLDEEGRSLFINATILEWVLHKGEKVQFFNKDINAIRIYP